ncbi:hypothetical protein G5V57_02830 [Nordella sp. HKS 07]|uniref:hypothetical protein n=1 Tax=Nordella sp. HKS 07 TaxID=2712222 RepID=UPI0013E1D290|nr:hypothetical protein [Nordella sp. HKS 07]QIG46778.1 hypothetical protein G5V57_02830 [Nordella sp. HKS 07]
MKKTILATMAVLAMLAASQAAFADGRGPGGDSGINNGGAPDGRGHGSADGGGGGE